ncbi:MAG: DUF1801 domain-containing protein [Pleurocapsa minor GSE-CHR-MK-17-07R]|jgi:uncharacterized protein YdhG (YjbR/CyaY superfamily)|nr:DUF1801 domain-containing protein [Pleurocapsa minor GSE-CHR-MK 17-07R]
MSEDSKNAKKTRKKAAGFSEAEQAAMKERAKELKAGKSREAGESALLEKIAEMPEPERSMATRLHEIITASAPQLAPKTWYGMPAYTKDGKVVVFFQSAHKFESRYATIGFNDSARLDDGNMWPVSFALVELTAAEEAKIIEMVKRAVG